MTDLSIVAFMSGLRPPKQTTLTERQEEVLDLLSRGLPYREIAEKVGICEGTVKYHKHVIIEVLGLAEYRRRVYVNG